MAIARKYLLQEDRPGCFHLISRCVRRAYLCGKKAEHRRDWVRDRIRAAAAAFAVDVLAYAIMGNHLHLVVRTDPERIGDWTALEVAQRWALAHPRLGADGQPEAWHPELIAWKARDAAWVGRTRIRLRSVSWFMKSIKEHLARRANRADGCTGHFWEGRFRSVPLLDERAVLACMAYVDLNPIRAAIADRPETSDYTSIQERIDHRQAQQAQALLTQSARSLPVPTTILDRTAEAAQQTAAEAGNWLAPVGSILVTMEQVPLLNRDDYLSLVDQTGRIVRAGKRGAIPSDLAPILTRLDLDLGAWMDLMSSGGSFRGAAFGSLRARAREVLRRGVRWVVDCTRGLYRDPAPHPA